MSEHRELVAELVIDAGNLFSQIRGKVVAALEEHAPLFAFGKMPPYLPPAFSKAVALGSIRQSGMCYWGRAAGNECWRYCLPSSSKPKLAIPVGTTIGLALPLKVVGSTAPVPAPPASGYMLASRNRYVEQAAVNLVAPFHVVEEEGRMLLPRRNLPAEVEAVNVVAQFGN